MELILGILIGATGVMVVLWINVKVFERRRTAATLRNVSRELTGLAEHPDVVELEEGSTAAGIAASAAVLMVAADALESGKQEPLVFTQDGWYITGDIEREK
jgi:hypothetical protein